MNGMPDPQTRTATVESQDNAAIPVLGELIAAGLVSHEMIGDPGRLGGETAALQALCGLVTGPVYRIDAYHYAFRAGPGDLDGRLGDTPHGDWTAALETALAEALGPEAAWLNPTDLLAEDAALAPPLMLLRAQDGAALEAAGPGVLAVLNARYATEVARLTAAAATGDGGEAGVSGDRLAAIEARQAAILERLEARDAARDAEAAALARLAETLAVALQRLDAQAEMLHGHIAREDKVAGRLAEIAALAGGPADFEDRLGLTLAEFLARIEGRFETLAEAAPQRVPQFS
jgi:hypothetical protein